jgi:diamine N-acetyltransferase
VKSTDPADISIRAATHADALCIGVLGTQVFLDTYAPDGITPSLAREVQHQMSTETITAALTMPAARTLVAEHAAHAAHVTHMVGFMQLTLGAKQELVEVDDAVEMNRLYVLERFTRRGIGRMLLESAEALAASSGAHALWLTAWEGNHRARAFYASQGYEDVGAAMYTFEEEHFENRVLAKMLR